MVYNINIELKGEILMNKIELVINKMKEYNVLDKEILNKAKEEMIKKAYSEKRYEDLVNNSNNELEYIDLSKVSYCVESFYKYSGVLEESFRNEIDYNNAMAKYEEENPDEEIIETWEELEDEYDEVLWNTAFKIKGFDINEENAELAKLIRISVYNKADEEYIGDYLVIKGCGMDMSFQILNYLCRELGSLINKYDTHEKIEWLRLNVSKNTFIELMVMAGLDKEKLLESL